MFVNCPFQFKKKEDVLPFVHTRLLIFDILSPRRSFESRCFGRIIKLFYNKIYILENCFISSEDVFQTQKIDISSEDVFPNKKKLFFW